MPGTQKNLNSADIKTTRSFLNQLIDVLQEDISSSVSRRKYQVFVTGGIGPGVTSSLFQTVYDQDFTLQTANPVFDVTVGLAAPDSIKNSGATNNVGIAAKTKTSQDSTGKYLYPSSSLMMREKTDIYGQFAQTLLGNRKSMFTLPDDVTAASNTSTEIDAALFIAFKRLFSRDQIKRETFAMRFYQSASYVDKTFASSGGGAAPPASPTNGIANLYRTSTSGSSILTDIGSANQRYFSIGGQYGYLVDASKTTKAVGLMYYDSGVVVLDVSKITSGSQFLSGAISAMHPLGQVMFGSDPNTNSTLVPDLFTSASIDDIVDHFCYSRFGDSALTAITFQNVTNINSSLIFCRALAEEFNYSSNPTYVENTSGQLSIYDATVDESLQEPFTYVTTIGLYDGAGGLLAVAKLSRPVEKSAGRDLTFRVRLDF